MPDFKKENTSKGCFLFCIVGKFFPTRDALSVCRRNTRRPVALQRHEAAGAVKYLAGSNSRWISIKNARFSMRGYMRANGYELDTTKSRFHHEIYLSDPRKCAAEKIKTVVQHPIRKA